MAGISRSPASCARKSASSLPFGSRSFHRRYTSSSNAARSAISSSGKPAMTSTPFFPSTIESRVRAATTPCRPGTYALAIALKASAVSSAGARVLSRGRGSLARCTLPVPEHVRWPRPSGTGPRGTRSSRETRFPCHPRSLVQQARSTGELSEREGERVGGEGGVVDGRGLPRRVASAGGADEEHSGRHARELRVHRVMAGAAHELGRVDADGFRGAAHEVAHTGVEGRRGDVRQDVDGRGEPARVTDPAYRRADVAHEIVEPTRRAEVEREDALPRDDVLRAWPHRDLADGADGVAAPLRQRLDREDHLARACEGVRARGHHGRARVVRAAAHGHAAVEDPDDVAHQAEREPAVGEAGSLLDVRLDVRGELLWVAPRGGGVATLSERTKRPRDRHAVTVATLERAIGQAAERGARPEEPDPEPCALLVRPGDDLDRAAEARPRVEDRVDGLDRAQDADRCVEPAALGHRVEMRADDGRGAPPLGPRRLETRPQVRRGVAAHRRATCAQPAADELARLLLLLGQTQARDRVAAATDPRELGDTPLEPRAVAQRTCSASASAGNATSANTSRSSAAASGIARSMSDAKRGWRRAVSRARSVRGSTTCPPRRSATYTSFSAGVRGAVAGSRTV